nr:hypothetical protein [Tanacetum cinerariifolium]
STWTRHAPDRMCLYIDAEEHELGDLGEPANYKAALLDSESEKWLNAMNVKMQSMKDNERSIYGLKQASRQWNKRFDNEIKKFGFIQNRDEPCVYIKASGSNVTFLILYVDDIMLMGNSIPMLQSVKTYLGKCFAMKDLEKILKRYCMENSKRGSIPMQEKLKLSKSHGASTPAEMKRMHNVPYASAVGSIMYAVRCTRPDVAGDLKQELRVSCYTDARYLTDADDLMSQTRYVFVLNGGAVDWKSAKQSIFATSSAKAEYITAFDASNEAV